MCQQALYQQTRVLRTVSLVRDRDGSLLFVLAKRSDVRIGSLLMRRMGIHVSAVLKADVADRDYTLCAPDANGEAGRPGILLQGIDAEGASDVAERLDGLSRTVLSSSFRVAVVPKSTRLRQLHEFARCEFFPGQASGVHSSVR